MNKKLNWTDWLNAFNNIDDEKHYKDLEILRKFKDQLLEELEQKDQRIAELEKENQKLKFEQNKIAIEKLEELEQWIMEQPTNDEYGYEENDFDDYISVGDLFEKIKEIKGETK